MKTIYFLDKPITAIERYISQYQEYYRNRYHDSGLWNESQILLGYEGEATIRRNEILALITHCLTPDIVQGRKLDNSLLFGWRSKTISVRWEDEGENRIITDLQID